MELDTPIGLLGLLSSLDATPEAMQGAFIARLRELQRANSGEGARGDGFDAQRWREWYARLLQILRVDIGDPVCVPRVIDLVRWGDGIGMTLHSHRQGVAALGWACRDAIPAHAPPAVLAALDARGALIARVWSRLHHADGAS